MSPELIAIATALKAMKRSNSGLTWIKQPHVTQFLETIAVVPAVTHEAMDALPPSRTREFVRGLLVEHGALPHRDRYLAIFGQWAREAEKRVVDPKSRDIVRRYIRWQHLRRMNHMQTEPHGTFLRSKQTTTVAIDLVNWLADQDVSLVDLQQHHLDRWVSSGPSTRLIGGRFLAWAIKAKLVSPDLTIMAHRRGTSPRMSAPDQTTAVQRIAYTDDLSDRDRAAAMLVLVFGQQIEDVVALTWDHVIVSHELVTVRVGAVDIALPDPLDQPWRTLFEHPGNGLTASHPNSNWVFRGQSPGQHVAAAHLRSRLKGVFSTRAARLGTLHELTKGTAVAIVAEALGYSPATIERHARDSATGYARYVAAVTGEHPSSTR